MTICIASFFRWNYGTTEAPDVGIAAVTISDRMLTVGDIQYQPSQPKLAWLSERAIVLIAGDYTFHSQAIKEAEKAIKWNSSVSPEDAAAIYGRAIQTLKAREAESIYLAPLGMNTDTFFGQLKDYPESFVNRIVSQLQDHKGHDVEALIVGSDERSAHIYSVNSQGLAEFCNDIGFAAIGGGAWQAKALLMQLGVTNQAKFAPALAAAFAAKKSAEIAPGVGSVTDVRLVFRDRVEVLWPEVLDKLEELYKKYLEANARLALESIEQLQASFADIVEKRQELEEGAIAGTDAAADGSPTAPAPEAARPDETGSEENG